MSPSEAAWRSRGRRAFEHTTAPYRAPHSFWRQQALHATISDTKLAPLSLCTASSDTNLAPRATRWHFRYKTRPARPKWPYLAHFPLAGRVLSRYRQQQAPHATGTGTKLTQRAPHTTSSGTKLALHAQKGPFQHVLRQQGELCTATATNKPSREKLVPHARPGPSARGRQGRHSAKIACNSIT